jgi:hypothetical protein
VDPVGRLPVDGPVLYRTVSLRRGAEPVNTSLQCPYGACNRPFARFIELLSGLRQRKPFRSVGDMFVGRWVEGSERCGTMQYEQQR